MQTHDYFYRLVCDRSARRRRQRAVEGDCNGYGKRKLAMLTPILGYDNGVIAPRCGSICGAIGKLQGEMPIAHGFDFVRHALLADVLRIPTVSCRRRWQNATLSK